MLSDVFSLGPSGGSGLSLSDINFFSKAGSVKPRMSLLREKLFPEEDAYFRANPHVAGMAADDDLVILNPYSGRSDPERSAVYANEAARLWMRKTGTPAFPLTADQSRFLDGTEYSRGSSDDRRATILARILSGDPSAGQATREQIDAANKIRRRMIY